MNEREGRDLGTEWEKRISDGQITRLNGKKGCLCMKENGDGKKREKEWSVSSEPENKKRNLIHDERVINKQRTKATSADDDDYNHDPQMIIIGDGGDDDDEDHDTISWFSFSSYAIWWWSRWRRWPNVQITLTQRLSGIMELNGLQKSW